MIAATSVTLHPFQGNPSELQVSFPAGERVAYNMAAHSSQTGWVWAKLESTGSTGWCPLTYLTPPEIVPWRHHPPASATPPPAWAAPIAPAVVHQELQLDNTDRGSIDVAATPVATTGWADMKQVGRKSWLAVSNGAQAAGTAISNGAQVTGAHARKAFVNAKEGVQDLDIRPNTDGSATSRTLQFSGQSSGEAQTVAGTPMTTSGGADVPGQGNGSKGAFQNFGSSIQQAGQKSWVAVSNGAQVAEAHASQAFANVKDLQQKQQAASNKPSCQRSAGEQRTIDVGNYAARGAVTNGIYHGIMSGGNPIAMARGAARGGAFGGAYGATARWKPFG